MTDLEFIRAIEDNEAEYFQTLRALGPQVEIEKQGSGTLLATHVDFWLFNGVFRPRIDPANPEATVGRWIDYFRARKLPFGVFLFPPERNERTEDILRKKGFSTQGESHLVIFDTDSASQNEVATLSAKYTVRDVQNKADFEKFTRCWAEAFKVPDAFRSVFVSWAEAYGFNERLPARSLAILDGDRAVAIASYYIDSKVAGLYNIAVDSDYRRLGLGVQITLEIAKRARRSGVRYLCGTGSMEGMRVYRKFGIREVGTSRRWIFNTTS